MTAKTLILVTRWLSFDDVVSYAKRERCFVPVIVRDTQKKNKGYSYCVARACGHNEHCSYYFDTIQLSSRYEIVGKVM